ncbi:hypothetical protein [Endozoicomonas sp. SCSIO W0465]|uniref:hypothetical protein n=1 Tax=Endozoicomonas sp. SCSIO W0465 TaxID=2918516 RepID=UPI002076355A|nr:hypothetical protein [Endozoicomonas sp. SCSIO W0465]USE36713.1 hypothetical protein MJO57_00235 [Endozoicomonas sp. SCSIO W0465]
MLPNIAINNTRPLEDRPLPKAVESAQNQAEQPGYFNFFPVELIQAIARHLTLPDALRLKQACRRTNEAIDQRTIRPLMSQIQFKNMETLPRGSKYDDMIPWYNFCINHNYYKHYAYNQNTGLIENPESVNIENFFSILKLSNASTKYKDKMYTMCTGLFENGHVFLIAPRYTNSIEEDANNPSKVLFTGDPSKFDINAIYSGRSFQEVKKLINIIHQNDPIWSHIDHILDHQYK